MPNPTIDRTRPGGLRPPTRAGHRERWASQETLAAELVLEANRTLTAEAIGNKGVIRDPLVLAAE